jgi:hypothetical protein
MVDPVHIRRGPRIDLFFSVDIIGNGKNRPSLYATDLGALEKRRAFHLDSVTAPMLVPGIFFQDKFLPKDAGRRFGG